MYFIANWKMHGNAKYIERTKVVKKLLRLKKYKNHKIIYCPPFTLLKEFCDNVKKSNLYIGAQDCHPDADFGPFTGSVNTKLIRSTGAKYVIVGHSEKRKDGDNNNLINKKIKSALSENLKVIFCVGEKLKEKRKKLTYKILKRQINEGLRKIKQNENIILAYEPVWSIGTGKIPKISELRININYIRKILKNSNKSKKIKIIYGGSVNPKNIKQLTEINEIKGFIIGGASLSSKKFIDIIKKSIN